jgi:CBS domain containing-hemolysin-like protein
MEELFWLLLVTALGVQVVLNLWRGVLEEEPWLLLSERPGEEARTHWAALSFWETIAEGVLLFSIFFLLHEWGISLQWQLVGVAIALVLIGSLKPIVQAVGMFSAGALFPVFRRFLPVLQLLEVPWRFMRRWRRLPDPRGMELARQELTTVVETAHQEGALEPEEYRLVTNLMRLRSIRVADVMTPRTVMVSCPVDIAVRDALRIPELRIYSRIPVWEGEPDTIVGYVLTKELLWAALEGKAERPVRDFVREVQFLPEHVELDRALEAFLQKRQHLFVVVDEYGGVEGVVTLEDVMETLLGVEIVDEADRVADLRELAKQLRQERIARVRAASTGQHSSSSMEAP